MTIRDTAMWQVGHGLVPIAAGVKLEVERDVTVQQAELLVATGDAAAIPHNSPHVFLTRKAFLEIMKERTHGK